MGNGYSRIQDCRTNILDKLRKIVIQWLYLKTPNIAHFVLFGMPMEHFLIMKSQISYLVTMEIQSSVF